MDLDATGLFDQLALFNESAAQGRTESDPLNVEVEAGGRTLVIIIGLLRSGYSAEQLVELITFGDQSIHVAPRDGCAVITSFSGTGPAVIAGGIGRLPTVPPARTPDAACADALRSSAASVEDEPMATTTDVTTTEPPIPEDDFKFIDDKTEWTSDMTLAMDGATAFGPATVLINRTPGTDDFWMSATAGTSSVSDFLFPGEIDPRPCTKTFVVTFDGDGTFDESGSFLVFTGTWTSDGDSPDCGEDAAAGVTERSDWQQFVSITNLGLEGTFEGFEFSIPGAPRPIAQQ